MKLVIIGPYNSVHIQKRVDFLKKRNISFLVIDFYNKYINLFPFNLDKVDSDKINNYVKDKYYIKINKLGNQFFYRKQVCKNILRRVIKIIFSDAIKNLVYFYFFYRKHLVGIISAFKPDIINSHILSSYSYFATNINFKPVVCTGWGSDILIHPKKNLIYRYMVRSTLHNAAGVLVDSYNLQKEIIDNYKYNVTVKVIPLGIDIDLIKRIKVHSKNKPVIFVSTRALERIYNINLVIKFFYYIEKIYNKNDMVLYILNDGSELYELKKLVRFLDLENKVKFFGKVNQDKLYNILKNADVYLSFSSSDGTSVSLLEAMYSGMIVAVSDIEANRYWVKNKVNGFLIDLRNINCGANELIKHLSDVNKYKSRFFKINKKIIETRANLHKNLEQELKFMKRIVSV